MSDAIDNFSDAAERLDRAVERAVRRAEARADGAEAQGEVILRLRDEIVALKKAIQEAGVRPAKPKPAERGGPSVEHERIEPAFAAG